MITSLRFRDWKSFGHTTLAVDELTLLVGLNASGKSNALDGMELLRRLVMGLDVELALRGDSGVPGIRGGREWVAFRQCKRFGLGATVQTALGTFDYDIEIEMNGAARVSKETLQEWPSVGLEAEPKRVLFGLGENDDWLRREGGTGTMFVRREGAQLPRLLYGEGPSELQRKMQAVQAALSQILVLRPIPESMRGYVPIGGPLDTAAAAAAGTLAAFDDGQKALFEHLVSTWASRLTGVAIQRVLAPPYGPKGADTILVAEELWPDGSVLAVDARAMSDGTLRFLSVAIALCAMRPASLLVIDEVDDNLHPSRVGLLLEMLRDGAARRGIDVLVTSQSSAMHDAADPTLVSSLRVVTRRPSDGASVIVSADQMPGLTHALASSRLGTLTEMGTLDELARGAEGQQ